MSLPLPRTFPRDGGPLNGYSPWLQHETLRRRKKVPLLHIILFLVTLVTTCMAGAFQQGANPFADPFALVHGLPFAVTLMSILLFHEMGHYVVARWHGVRASLPYFIPGPPFFVGTFGAFIRMQSPPANRRALFDVGAAGPWAGVALAIPAVVIGLSLSEVRPLTPLEGGVILGDSMLFSLLTRLVLGVSADEVSVILHPVALAGWFGLFVTFLNLLPVGQLDGGHITYSLFGRTHRWISRVALLGIVLLGFHGWQGWFVWAVLLFVLGVDHPPTLDLFPSLDLRRKFYGWCTVALFVLTFIPVPITITERPTGETIPVSYRLGHSSPPVPLSFVYRP
ncbi:MAG: site-2 protease family protein [Candidatus Binatia bacterium]|nr:site-2 protease family protein [Candidatus Binatia bacterium]